MQPTTGWGFPTHQITCLLAVATATSEVPIEENPCACIPMPAVLGGHQNGGDPMTRGTLALAGILALPLAATSCSDLIDDSVTSAENAALGDALPGTNATLFAEARAAFAAVETVQDGLGPIFNERACGICHSNSALGGAGQQIERRYGTLTNGVFDPLANTGGSLRQLFGIGGFNVGGLNCNSGTDANPAAGATIFAGRLTTPVFGLGLVDSLADSAFDALAARQPAAIR